MLNVRTGRIQTHARRLIAVFALAFFLLTPAASWACTSIVVGKDASASGNVIFARTEDYRPTAAKRFFAYPAGFYKAGSVLTDTNGFEYTFTHSSYKFTGVPDMPVNGGELYDQHGTNEHGLGISATNTTSFSGGAELMDPLVSDGIQEAVLPTILLAEAKTPAEAITLAGNLVERYGASESFLFIAADKNEAWIFETVSGHRWVASRVPDDSYVIVANDMVTDTIDLADAANYRGTADVEQKALDNGFAVHDSDGVFSVAASYAKGAINQEGNSYRRWRGYNLFSPSLNIDVRGNFVTLPYKTFQKPDSKITVTEIMRFQRDRYNGTLYDQTESAQAWSSSGREIESTTPRVIGVVTQQETHIYEMKKNYPAEIAAQWWMATSQSEHSVYLPFYGAITDTHPFFKTEVNKESYQEDSAFWIFQDLAYLARGDRKKYGKPIQDYWRQYELQLYAEQSAVESELLSLYASNPAAARTMITNYTIATAQKAMNRASQIRTALKEHIAARPGETFIVPSELTAYADSILTTDLSSDELTGVANALGLAPSAVKAATLGTVTKKEIGWGQAPEVEGYTTLLTPGVSFEAPISAGNAAKVTYSVELKGEDYTEFNKSESEVKNRFALFKTFSAAGASDDVRQLVGPHGLISLPSAIDAGIASVYDSGSSATVTISFYLYDGEGNAAYRNGYLAVPDRTADGTLTDPLWAKARGQSGGSSGGSSGGGGCVSGAMGLALLFLVPLIFRSRKKYLAVIVLLSLLALPVAGLAAAPEIPYGQININANKELAVFQYPKVLQEYFDAKVKGIILNTPTLDRMAAAPNSAADLTSEEPGETARSTTQAEIEAFIANLPDTYMRSNVLATVASKSGTGAVEAVFDLPMLIFSKPPVYGAADLKALGKPIVYFQGSIHGNEMSGAEAMLAIAQDLSVNRKGLLDHISVIITPRFNVDGAWQNQRGTNSTNPDFANVDQNRDAVATLSPITRIIRNMLVTYRPDVFVDFHEMGYTSSGSAEYAEGGSATRGYKYYHDYDLATLVAHPYNVPSGVTKLAYELETGVVQAAAAAGLKSTFYYYNGDMVPDYKSNRSDTDVMQQNGDIVPGYVTYPNQLMEGPPDECITDSAASLNPSITMLFETRSPKILTNFKTRVYTHYVTGLSILDQIAARPAVFLKAVSDGAQEVINMGRNPSAADDLVLWAKQYEELNPTLPVLALNPDKTKVEPLDLKMDKFHRNHTLSVVKSVKRPYAYVLSADADNAPHLAARLALTGVTMSRLTEDTEISVEAYRVKSVAAGTDESLSYTVRKGDYFPMNQTLAYGIDDVSQEKQTYTFPKGTYLFYMAQPSANLAALAVEPMGNRNLGNYWYTLKQGAKTNIAGYLPFTIGDEFPAYRYMTASDLPSETMLATMPFIKGAQVSSVVPFSLAETDAGYELSEPVRFGYFFKAHDPQTGGVPSSFNIGLPMRDAVGSYGGWYLFNWSSGVFEAATVLVDAGFGTARVDSRYIDSSGRVWAVATGHKSSGGGGSSSGCSTGIPGFAFVLLLATGTVVGKIKAGVQGPTATGRYR